MAAATAYSSYFDSSGNPIAGLPTTFPFGGSFVPFSITIPTTSLDDIGDIFEIQAVASRYKVIGLLLAASTAMDSGTALDMDIVLRTTDADGNHTDTILENAGTAYEAARSNQILYFNATVPQSARGFGRLVYKVNAAATTPVEGTVTGFILVQAA